MRRFIRFGLAVTCFALSTTALADNCTLPGDIDGDGNVDLSDLGIVLSNFGQHVDINAGLVAYFPFDTDYADAAGGFPVTAHGGVSITTGRVGAGSAAFNGTNSWLEVVHGDGHSVGALTFDIDTQSYSIAMWVKMNPGQADPVFINDRGSADQTVSYVLGENLSREAVNASMWFGPATNVNLNAETSRTPLLGNWVHLVGVYRPNVGVQLFVDGALAGSSPAPSSSFSPNTTGVTTIGAGFYPEGLIDFFSGDIDELRIYNRALNSAEICELASQ